MRPTTVYEFMARIAKPVKIGNNLVYSPAISVIDRQAGHILLKESNKETGDTEYLILISGNFVKAVRRTYYYSGQCTGVSADLHNDLHMSVGVHANPIRSSEHDSINIGFGHNGRLSSAWYAPIPDYTFRELYMSSFDKDDIERDESFLRIRNNAVENAVAARHSEFLIQGTAMNNRLPIRKPMSTYIFSKGGELRRAFQDLLCRLERVDNPTPEPYQLDRELPVGSVFEDGVFKSRVQEETDNHLVIVQENAQTGKRKTVTLPLTINQPQLMGHLLSGQWHEVDKSVHAGLLFTSS